MGPQGVPGANGSDGAAGPQGPQGIDGAQGIQGADGPQGPQGAQGPQGLPFGSTVVDGVNTLPPGDPATAGTFFDGVNVHFTFGIPRGVTGAAGGQGIQGVQGDVGPQGAQGPDGAQGPQGVPGEVTSQQLNDAVATTARNPVAVGPFGGGFSDPPTQAELQALAAYVETLRTALVR